MKHALWILLAGFIFLGCSDKKDEAKKKPAADTNENYSSGNPVTAPVDYLGAVNKARKTAIRQIDLAQVKHAIQLYQATEDHYPASLQELVKKNYLGEVPVPPRDSRLEYNPQTGEVRIVRQ
jgi:hypothetical protein